MPKVSVILPTYNRVNYLLESVNSILEQSFTDFELIISDNASTDNTEEIVKGIKDKRIVYNRNAKNIGVSRNYNKCLELCTGEYIQIFSDDDIMMKDCLSKSVSILDGNLDVGLVHTDIKMIDAQGKIISNSHWANMAWKKWATVHNSSKLFNKETYHKYLYRIQNIICMPTVMIRKSIISKIGYMDEALKVLVDLDYWLKITLFSDVYFINEKLVYYRTHPGSTYLHDSSIDVNKRELEHIKNSLKNNFSESTIVNNKLQDVMQTSMFYFHYNYLALGMALVKSILRIKK